MAESVVNACVICGHNHTDNACFPWCAGCDRPLDQVVAGIDAGCPVCLRFVEEGLEAMAESSKPPCLFPLPDSRRCCECETCHGEQETVACSCSWLRDPECGEHGNQARRVARAGTALPGSVVPGGVRHG